MKRGVGVRLRLRLRLWLRLRLRLRPRPRLRLRVGLRIGVRFGGSARRAPSRITPDHARSRQITPDHAPGCPELQPASANQPLGHALAP